MNLLVENQIRPKNKYAAQWIAAGILVGILSSLFLLYFIYFVRIPSSSPILTTSTTVEAPPLKGAIYVTITSYATNTESVIASGVLNVSDSTLHELPVAKVNGTKTATLQYNMSNNFEYTAFLGSPVSTSSSGAVLDKSFEVYLADIQNASNFESYIASLEDATQITKYAADDFYKIAPAVSNNKVVAYASLNEETYDAQEDMLSSLPAEEWNIFVISQSELKSKLTEGISPKWVDDERFVFLKNDGVYLYDLTRNTAELVFSTQNQNTITTGFDMANNGHTFVLSYPERGEMKLVNMTNWSSMLFAPITTIPVVATNPVFSPDSNFIAMLTFEPRDNTHNEKITSVSYYSPITQTFLEEKVTFESGADGIFLTDWK